VFVRSFYDRRDTSASHLTTPPRFFFSPAAGHRFDNETPVEEVVRDAAGDDGSRQLLEYSTSVIGAHHISPVLADASAS
jgi:hypothetical protein